jgi:hypothetical protein
MDDCNDRDSDRFMFHHGTFWKLMVDGSMQKVTRRAAAIKASVSTSRPLNTLDSTTLDARIQGMSGRNITSRAFLLRGSGVVGRGRDELRCSRIQMTVGPFLSHRKLYS